MLRSNFSKWGWCFIYAVQQTTALHVHLPAFITLVREKISTKQAQGAVWQLSLFMFRLAAWKVCLARCLLCCRQGLPALLPFPTPPPLKKKSHHKQVLSYLQTRPSQSQASDSLNSIRRHWVTSVSQLSTPTQALVRLTIIYVAALWDSSFTNDTRVHARELI